MAAPLSPPFPPPLHDKPKLSAAFIGQVLLVTLQAVATVAIVAALGAFLAVRGWLTKEGKQLLSRLSMNVTIPCLLFSQVVPSIRPALLAFCWPLLLLPFIYVPVGLCFGRLVVRLTKPKESQRSSVMVACAFGNSTGLPIVLITVVGNTLLRSKLSDAEIASYGSSVDPIAYLSIYLIFYPVLQWVVGGALLGLGADGNAPDPVADATRAGWRASVDAPLLSKDEEEEEAEDQALASPSPVQWDDGDLVVDESFSKAMERGWRRVRANALPALKQLTLPPVAATLVGAALGLLPVPKEWWTPKSNPTPFSWVLSAAKLLGGAAVPVNLVLLGASLSKGRESLAGVTDPAGRRMLAGVVCAKMVAMPLCAALICVLARYVLPAEYTTPPFDQPFWLVALLVTCTPTANNMLVMVELAGGDGEAFSAMIAVQYFLAPLLLTVSVSCMLALITLDL